MKESFFLFSLLIIVSGLCSQSILPQPIAIRQGTNIEWFRSSTAIENGVVYVWSDTRNGDRDLFAQLISLSGTKLWGEEGIVIDNANERQEDPMIITATDGSVIIGYVDYSQDDLGDIRMNKINSNGEKQWGDRGVSICNLNGVQFSINLVTDSEGGAYIVWHDERINYAQTYVQHVNASGTISFPENGFNLYPISEHLGANTFWEDNEGGAVIAFEVQGEVQILRIHKDNREIIEWGPKKLMPSLAYSQRNPKMCPDGVGGFIFAVEFLDPTINESLRIRAQRIDLTGNLLWTEGGKNITSSVIRQQEKHRVLEVDTGGFIIAWEDKINAYSDVSNIYINRYDLDGNSLWQNNGQAVYSINASQSNLRIAPTNAHGAVIVWEDTRYVHNEQPQIFAQKFSATGSVEWEAEGKLVCNTIGRQSGVNVKQIGNDFALVWSDERTGSVALMTQHLSNTGTSLFPIATGMEIFSGLSGQAGLAADNVDFYVRTFQNKTYIVWNDSRHGSYYGFKLFYQIVDENGNFMFEDNGRRVTEYDPLLTLHETRLAVEMNVHGEMCIAWSQSRGEFQTIFVQIINAQGERLLAPQGVELKQNGDCSENAPVITWRNNGWEIYWSENINSGFFSGLATYGQRIQNNNLVWGGAAKEILSEYNANLGTGNNIAPFKVVEDYLLFARGSLETRILKLDQEGNIAPDWGNLGKKIVDKNYPLMYLFSTDTNLVAFWTQTIMIDEIYSTPNRLFLGLFTLDGEPAFSNHLINISDIAADQEHLGLTVYQQNNIFTLTYTESSIEGGQLRNISKSQRVEITPTGYSKLWTPASGVNVSTSNLEHHNNLVSVPLGEDNLVVWSMIGANDPDIFMSRLNSNGEYTGTGQAYLINDHNREQILPALVKHQNGKVSVVWIDGISSGKESIWGIYMQISDGTVANFDIVKDKVKPLLVVKGNYPNPFNPSTTIEFNLFQGSQVSIDIYNIKGQKVRNLARDYFEHGKNFVVWNGENDDLQPVGSGIYFYRIKAGEQINTAKMLLLK